MQKVPYVVVVGNQEVAGGKISVRAQQEKTVETMAAEELARRIGAKYDVNAPRQIGF